MTKTVIFRIEYVVAILLLVVIAIPTFLQPRHYVSTNACINNWRMIASAKERWAKDNGKTNGDEVVVAEVNRYIKGNTTPVCPGGGSYS